MIQARTKSVLGNPGMKRMQDPFIQNVYGRALGLGESARTLTLTTRSGVDRILS